MNSTFKLPIEYVNYNILDEGIKQDIDFKSLSEILFGEKTNKLKINGFLKDKWFMLYTDNKKYLKNTQKIIKNMDFNINNQLINDMYETFTENSKNKNFIQKYQYIEHDYFKQLNENGHILQLLSYYKLSTPVLSLLFPLVLLIIPFVILKMKGLNISFNNYWDLLKPILQKHFIGKYLADFKNISIQNKMYFLFSILFYVFQIYQNCSLCYKFYNNISTIQDKLQLTKNYITHIISSYDYFTKTFGEYKEYKPFIQQINLNREKLIKIHTEISEININNKSKLNLIVNFGSMLKNFYKIYQNVDNIQTINYSFYWICYLNNIKSLKHLVDSKKIKKCTFKSSKTSIKNVYYPHLIQFDDEIVKNTISFEKNHIITGPNAAGKTTLLKAVFVNILLSQQIGHGFYDKANIFLYKKFYSYINIPDTSNRDSLFQSEVRRCKEILDNTDNGRIFCIFDELYSGTNHEEAISTGYSFIHYLSQNNNINFILTTHFKKISSLMEKNKVSNISNKKMEIKTNGSTISYTYKLTKGISYYKGGLNILKQFNYPNKILEKAQMILNTF